MSNKFSVKLVLLLIAFCLLVININLLSKSNSDLNKQTIMTVGNKNVTFGEVKKVYDKNVQRDGIVFELISRDSAKSFLDAYSKYKMKIAFGLDEGYDKDSAIVDEINRNRRVLAEAYLIESEVIEPAIQRYTEMRKKQRQIAIIMTDFTSSGDTTAAYEKITAALSEINKGESFEYAAKKYSSDTSTGNHGGVVPVWVTGLRLQRDLEGAIYDLKVGEIIKTPLKTNYGYFIIKILKEEPRIFIGLSHILIPYNNDNTDIGPIIKDTSDARRLADSLFYILSKGENFYSIAEKFSSDKVTSMKGGNIGVYARSTGIVGAGNYLSPDIENTAFELKDKQISKPIETHFGIHIIRRDSTVIYPDNFEYNEMKSNYERIFQKEDKQKYYDSLAKNYNFEINTSVLNKMLSSIDTTKTVFDSSFINSISADIMSQTLYSINGQTFSVKNFVDTITTNVFHSIASANREGLTEAIKTMIQPIIINNATKNISKTHPNFDMVIDEFNAGLILFKAEQEKIWNKVIFDSVRAKRFYDTTKMDLQIPLKYDISEIYIMNKKKVDEVYEDIKTDKINFDSAVSLYSQRPGIREKKGHYGIVSTANYLAYQAVKNGYKIGDISEPLSFEQGFSIIRINNILPERRMTFEEALPHISTIVQTELVDELQNNWMNELNKKYPVKFNDKLINKVFKK